MDHEERLVELETKVAHQDHTIIELGEEIYRQQQQIVFLEGLCRQLNERLQSLPSTGSPGDPSDEVPPHY